MAVDVCSDISSPRISFSHDLNQSENVPADNYHRRLDSSLLDSSFHFDFDFCVAQQLPSADELFSDGKILPVQIREVTAREEIHRPEPIADAVPPQPTTTSRNENANDDSKKKRLKEFLSSSCDAEEEEEKPLTRSFWQFRRSSSLNCDSGGSKGLIRSLQFLSRSNSTGSAPKQTALPKETQKQQSPKRPPSIATPKPPAPCPTAFHSYGSLRKAPSRKNCRSHGDGIRISPVLNIPPTYISKGTVGLFGIGSLFCNGKAKKKKK